MPLPPDEIKKYRSKFKTKDAQSALNEIADENAKIALPVLIDALEEIKSINEHEMEVAYRVIKGVALKEKNETMEEAIKTILGNDIETISRNLIEDKDTKLVKDENVKIVKDAKINSIKLIPKESVKKLIDDMVYDFSQNQGLNAKDGITEFFLNSLRTEIYLICALALHKDADTRQNASWYQLVNMLRFSADDILKPFSLVVHAALEVYMTDQTKHLWKEVILRLNGLFLHSHNQLPKDNQGNVIKDSDGSYPAVKGDKQDERFKSYFKLTKCDIADYYKKISESLQFCLDSPEHQAKFKVIGSNIVSANPNGNTVLTGNQAKNDNKVKKHFQLRVDYYLSEGQENKTFQYIDLIKKDVPGAKVEINEDPPNKEPDTLKKGIPVSELSKYQNNKEEVKFTELIFLLQNYGLSERQSDILKGYKKVIISTLNSYITNPFTTSKIPTIFHSRPHIDPVKHKMEKIKNTDDPVTYIKVLFTLWNEMKGVNSRDMQDKITILLNDIYAFLLNPAPTPQQERKIANRMY